MVLDYQGQISAQFRDFAAYIVYPMQKIVDLPLNLTDKFKVYFTSYKELIVENKTLKQKYFELLVRQQKYLALERENAHLRELLNSAPQPKENLLAANILQVNPDPFTHQVILDKGADQGVYLGQPVIDAKGIMGTVIMVNKFTSRVMLVTDGSYAVPVENIRNGTRAIAVGTGMSGQLELQYLPNTADIKIGDILITSGLDGKYPYGYPVGIIAHVANSDQSKAFATVLVKPIANIASSRQVLLIHNHDIH